MQRVSGRHLGSAGHAPPGNFDPNSSEMARNGSKTISSLSSDEISSSYSTKPMASRKTDPRTSESRTRI